MAVERIETVKGNVVEITHDLARVLIGPNEEEWYFPMATLPEGADVGTKILFIEENGRYAAHSLAGARNTNREIEDRLSRPLSLRKTADFRASDFRTEIDADDD